MYFLGKLQIWFRGKCKRSNLCSSSVPLLKSPLGPRTAVSGGGLVEGDGLGGGLAAYYEKAFGASFGKTSHHISDRLHKQNIKFTFRSRSEPERQYHRCCGRCVLCRPRRAPRIFRDRLLGGQTSHCLRKLTQSKGFSRSSCTAYSCSTWATNPGARAAKIRHTRSLIPRAAVR